MKRGLISLFAIFVSFNAAAASVTCTSESNMAKKLELSELGFGMVQGKSYIRTYTDVFAGTVEKTGFLESTYNLFNKDGESVTFILKKKPNLGGGHCRARYCPPSDVPANFENHTGKLVKAGQDDEYFSCF